MPEEMHQFLEEVCKFIPQQQIKDFCKLLYKDVPLENISILDSNIISEAVISIFDLLQNRSAHASSINLIKLGKNDNNDLIALEIITPNIPFLVESISNELKKHGAKIYLIVHPAIKIERNKNGSLKEINSIKGEDEAVMQFFISNHFTDQYHENIKKVAKEVIECVRLVVEDWKQMQNLMKEAIKNINSKHWYQSINPLKKESVQFLEWMLEDKFIFLGSITVDNIRTKSKIDTDQNLGMTKTEIYRDEVTTSDIDHDEDNIILIKKSNNRSIVHRDSYMNCIQVKQFDKNGEYDSAIIFIGFFASAVYMESVRKIPLIRTKIDKVLDRYGYSENSYNAKELITAMENFPRSDLVQMTEDELFEIATGMVSLNLMPRTKVFLRQDNASNLVHCFVFIPKIKFSAEIMHTVERIVSQQICGTVSRYYVNVGESQLARLQIIVKPKKNIKKEYNTKKIEELITEATSVWLDDLSRALEIKYGSQIGLDKFNKFKNAFNLGYTSSFSPKQAVHDIKMSELAIAENKIKFDFYLSSKSGKDFLQLKVFSPYKELPLSLTLPIIENFGFFIVDTLTFKLSLENQTKENNYIFIHHFRVTVIDKSISSLALSAVTKKSVETALEKIYCHEFENDKFNSLILSAEICWKEVVIIKAYNAYLKQICFNYSASVIAENLINYPILTKKLIELFNIKFSLQELADRQLKLETAYKNFSEDLSKIPNLIADHIFKAYIELIKATERTNFFKRYNADFVNKGISLKISSEKIENIPLPKPFREIFVYSMRYEAVHLRGGKIARGGIRWSDRNDDFRTEILGLMKAQMTKNAVIVPVGSKGGFILKAIKSDSADFYNEGVECYKNFLRCMLDITDNIIKRQNIRSEDVICYDEEDTYLVVAADKGTAAFSDYANSVAREYNFWLDDAFASGGSAGYDHKKMAITSRGSWISAQDHMNRAGIDINTQEFTTVGIGDMSGDVFGNGMLMSRKCKLIAAFNHLHIFIDPNPDPEKSYIERERLFKMPRSKWSDYDSNIISKGGGVFSRDLKSINISPEVKQALGISDDILEPNQLIKMILKAPVDILWNGGIGTYIKASSESDSNIKDKTNDCVRINGKELRCRAAIESGNLGSTQLGRIEFARNGGSINTDFIDNSGGVDCSDHEVNIKIAFSDLLQKNGITFDARDKLLKEMTGAVADLVLQDNKNQTLLISLEEHRGKRRLEEHFWLIKHLESKKELNRELEKLPPIDNQSEVAARYGKLTRSEIAVLIAYGKNSAIKLSLAAIKDTNDLLNKYLIDYFPKVMQENFKDVLLDHKLKIEIIITSIVNHFVNTFGCCFFHQLIERGYTAHDIVNVFAITVEVFDLKLVWDRIINQKNVTAQAKLGCLLSFIDTTSKFISWILYHNEHLLDIERIFSELRDDFYDLRKVICSIQFGHDENLLKEGFEIDLIESLAQIKAIVLLLETITIKKQSNKTIHEAVKGYNITLSILGIDKFLDQLNCIEIADYSQNNALEIMLLKLTSLIAKYVSTNSIEFLENELRKNREVNNYREFLYEMMRDINSNNIVAVLVIVLDRLKELIKS